MHECLQPYLHTAQLDGASCEALAQRSNQVVARGRQVTVPRLVATVVGVAAQAHVHRTQRRAPHRRRVGCLCLVQQRQVAALLLLPGQRPSPGLRPWSIGPSSRSRSRSLAATTAALAAAVQQRGAAASTWRASATPALGLALAPAEPALEVIVGVVVEVLELGTQLAAQGERLCQLALRRRHLVHRGG